MVFVLFSLHGEDVCWKDGRDVMTFHPLPGHKIFFSENDVNETVWPLQF